MKKVSISNYKSILTKATSMPNLHIGGLGSMLKKRKPAVNKGQMLETYFISELIFLANSLKALEQVT